MEQDRPLLHRYASAISRRSLMISYSKWTRIPARPASSLLLRAPILSFSMRAVLFSSLLLTVAPALAQSTDWTSYVLGPSSRTVLPKAILRTSAAGVDNADALLGKSTDPARLTASAGQAKWPDGTTASASSEHAPATESSYAASNAVDGNPTTFWNDVGACASKSVLLNLRLGYRGSIS